MLKIGLTGGIGCGKSTVANVFAQLNVPIVDADQIARRLVEKGQPALALIQQEFGTAILNPDESLDRKRLREIVFSETEKRQKLENILHPLVYQAIQTELEQLNAPYCIICIPLLFETEMTGFVDRVLVIDCPVETQMARVRARDNMAWERIQSIIDSQVSRDFRTRHADDLIDNSETGGRLAEQVKRLHNLYLSISTH
ncbi:MAG: dephospho-CoA kinase [Methylococcaceae bacterium]